MQEFTLPAGTTNRHQWHKQAMAAIESLRQLTLTRRELWGVKGVDERSNTVMVMTFGGNLENETAGELLSEIGDRFGWSITKENAGEVHQAVLEAIPVAEAAIPVDDNRETPEQREERVQENQKQNEIRQANQAERDQQIEILADELRAKYPWAIADTGKLSGYARAAKNMKIELGHTFPGVKFSVRSESFSMGNAVRVEWDNGPSAKTVEGITDKYSYYVDKCTDDNSATAKAVGKVLGQSKYVTTQRNLSSELKEQIGRDICKDHGQEYDTNTRIGDQWLSDLVWRVLAGFDIPLGGEYAGIELVNGDYVPQFTVPEMVTPVPIPQGDTIQAHIEEHVHTKKGFTMYMVIPDTRLDRDTFNQVRSAAKDAGGWYSRKWGSTPGGFAFEQRDQADAFLTSISGPTTEPPGPGKGNGDKFRKLAEGMQNQIDGKLADRQTNTPKRLAQARHSQLDGERLQRTQQALLGLAGLYDAGTVPPVLAGVTSKKQVYDLMGTKLEPVANGFHGYHVCTGEPRETSPEAVALWSLITAKTETEKQAEELQRKIDGLQFSNIPGYFPTPNAVIDKMIEYADIEPDHIVLEPELGSCAIADRVRPLCRAVSGFEVNYTLAEIAETKGYLIKRGDFLTVWEDEHREKYDRVLMNPPFEARQDIAHIKHAVKFLKPGGVLVAICSGGPKQVEELQPIADHWEELPPGAFKSSGTNIGTVLLAIRN